MAHLIARNERGAVFLEFAVVLPLLLSLVLGIFTGGMAYTSKVGVVEAVREGARRRAWAGRRRPSSPSRSCSRWCCSSSRRSWAWSSARPISPSAVWAAEPTRVAWARHEHGFPAPGRAVGVAGRAWRVL